MTPPRPWPEGAVSTGRSTLEVREVEPGQVALYIDGMESSHLDLNHPERLEFEYMQHIDAAVSSVVGDAAPVRAVHLGGAACALARAWNASRPGSMQLAVEWDAEIARLAREWFDLPRSPHLRIRTADARTALDGFPDNRWDVVVRDVFVRGAVPEHLADDGAWAHMMRVVSPGGVVVANLADSAPLAAARAEAAIALRSGHAVMIADPAVLKGRRFGNLVLAVSREHLDVVDIARRVQRLPLPARVLSGDDLRRFAGS